MPLLNERWGVFNVPTRGGVASGAQGLNVFCLFVFGFFFTTFKRFIHSTQPGGLLNDLSK